MDFSHKYVLRIQPLIWGKHPINVSIWYFAISNDNNFTFELSVSADLSVNNELRNPESSLICLLRAPHFLLMVLGILWTLFQLPVFLILSSFLHKHNVLSWCPYKTVSKYFESKL